ncbi:MAG: response regulator transcription factor [Bacteroidota bacterium]
MNVQIVLADDHKIMRDGLRSLLEKQPDLEVVGEADSGSVAIRLVRECSPDVVILDIAMPGLDGTEVARQIKNHNPDVKILALSMHSDKQFVKRMFSSGASGYLLKECAFDELIEAIRSVMANRTYLSPMLTSQVIKEYVLRGSDAGSTKPSFLTPRESEVLQLLAEGTTTKEIAYRLHVSVKTIETHRQQIMEKLDIHSVAQLTKYAIREGLTSLDR